MKYDLHLHTKYSPCSNMKPVSLLKAANKKGLDGVAVCDHGTMKGSIAVRKLNKNKNLEVILGSEIKTDHGDVLVFYQNEEIKSRELFAVIDEVKDQGALAAVAHPFRPVPWQKFKYPLGKLKGKIDAIETFNSRMILDGNRKAKEIAERFNLTQIGGSDAHFSFDVGKAYTLFDGSLRDAIKKGKTRSEGITSFALFSGLCSFFLRRLARKVYNP